MSDVLLPSNSSAAEFALEQSTARIADVPARVRDVWDPDTCPSNLLPWLAWAFSVDEWSKDWTDQQKRAAIKSAVEVQRYKGTIGAVRDALQSLGYGVRVQEWFNQIPVAAPYTFKLLLESSQVGIDQAALREILRVVYSSKNLRSHTSLIEVSVITRTNPSVGAVTGIGSELTISYGGGNLRLDGTWILDGTYKLNGIKYAS